MLIQFYVENFRSFKEEQQLNMVAVPAIKDHSNHILQDKKGKPISVVRTAALYGANASGKSNLIRAMYAAKTFITSGNPSFNLVSNPFKLDSSFMEKPTKFEFIFKYRGVVYHYGFAVDRFVVLEEWLSVTEISREKKWFVRKTEKSGKTNINIGNDLAQKNSEDYNYLKKYVQRGVKSQQLFLNEAIEKNFDKFIPVYEWFNKVLDVVAPSSFYKNLPRRALQDPSFSKFVANALKFADTGIHNISIQKNIIESNSMTQNQSFMQMHSVTKDFMIEGNDMFHETGTLQVSFENNEYVEYKLVPVHHDADSNQIDFEPTDESDGTLRFLNLIPALYTSRKEPRVFVFDELERSLHPLLSKKFVELFLGSKNTQNMQLIFSTHESNLLNQNLIRRDEVFFVEKDKMQASHISSLSDFKIRNDLNIEKGYLIGRFGAIPFFGDPSLIE